MTFKLNEHVNLCTIITLLMCMIATKATAHDIEVPNADGQTIYYRWINNKTELAVTYRGAWDAFHNSYTGEIVIPESVEYDGKTYKVTSIGKDAFLRCTNMWSVTIPNGITEIGESAFAGCTAIRKIELPNSVTFIASHAFEGSGLRNCTIPENITGIEEYTFYCCEDLTSVTIPNSVCTIGKGAFDSCSSLTSITISKNVTSIGDQAFYKCSALNTIIVEEGNPVYDSREECNAIIKTSENMLIIGCMKTTIPNSVTSIGEYAFTGSGLTSVTIPKSVISIGRGAFSYCSSLTTIKVEEENAVYDSRNNCNGIILTADNELVSGCSNTIIPNSVTSIGKSAFHGCSSLTSIAIPNSVTSIGEWAFSHCVGLTSITIPESVISISNYTCNYCIGLTTVTIGSNVTSIGYMAFYCCKKLKDFYCYAINIPETNDDTFMSCTLDKVTLHVPEQSFSIYKITNPWNSFKTIIPLSGEETGIKNIKITDSDAEWYQLNGHKSSSPKQGLNIIRTKNRKTRKVVVNR